MNLIEVTKNYHTQAKCLKLLEQLRWGKTVKCTFCSSKTVKSIKTEQGRYSCKNCNKSFSVIVGTIFEETRLPLPKWFQIITLMLNAKSGISAKEIERNLGITYKTAYYACMRIRIGMLMEDTKLNGIIEMDESYFGGIARSNKKTIEDNQISIATTSNKRGRGTNKVSVVGMVQRKGQVVTKVIEKLTKRNLLAMLKTYAKKDNSILITDGFRSYAELEKYIDRLVINHSKQYSRGIVHINTIEGYWSYVKNGIKGSFKAVSKKYLPIYLVEFEWKYNHRNFRGNQLEKYLKNALFQEKQLEHWKARSTQEVKNIAYGN
jgi:transposase-like protein